MTDIDILNTSWKTEVTPEQSAEIQRLLFKHGKRWINGSTEIQTSGNLIDDQLAYRKNHLSCCIIPSSYEEKIKKINADDIIAALRKLEEGNKPVSKETNEDGWISFYEEMPKINKEIELKFYRGHTPEKINAALKVLAMGTHGYFGFVYHDGNEEKELTLVPVESWRPIKEKRPDFGKLMEGDLISIYWKVNNLGGNLIGYFHDIDDEEIYIRSEYKDKERENSRDLKYITKITRINLETREFEEI